MRKVKYKVDFSNREIIVKSAMQNDNISLEIEVLDNGEQVSLAGSNIELLWVKPDNFPKKISENITLQNNKIIVNDVDVECTSISGICNFELTIKKSDKQISTFPLTLKVIQSVINNPRVENTVMKLLEELIIASNNGENVLVAMDKWAEEHQDLENITDVLSSVKASVKELSSQIAEIEKNEVRVETLNNAVKTYVNEGVEDGSILGMTIPEKSITEEKLSDEVREIIPQEYDDDIAYGVADKEGSLALYVKKDGTVVIPRIENLLKDGKLDISSLDIFKEDENEDISISWGVIDKFDNVSELCIDKSGRFPEWVLKAISRRFPITSELKSKIIEALSLKPNRIVCWGDSLTAGAGAGSWDKMYPYILGKLTGLETKNMGVGGESASSIAERQGAIPLTINPVIIPASGVVEITFRNTLGYGVDLFGQGEAGINPCYIGEIEGTLSKENSKYYFTRTTKGEEIELSRPTLLETYASREYNNEDDVAVIWVGTNNKQNTAEEIIEIQEYMVDYLKTNKFIILGLTFRPKDQTIDGTGPEEVNKKMEQRWGRKFLDIRKYILEYGLADAGIEATQEDLEAIQNGEIPPSLLADIVHYNSYGYSVISGRVTSKIKEEKYI